MKDNTLSLYSDIYSEIREILLQSRKQAYQAVNFAVVQAYWNIGRIIVEHEQNGNYRADYGKEILQNLSKQLTSEFGKGFNVRNLQKMKKFYALFPNTKCERIFTSRDKAHVEAEAKELMKPLATENLIKYPYVLEFLDLKNYPALRESDLEQALIDKSQDFLLERGRGFCFVARQKLMRYEDEDFYLDLVFYHSILKCYVLIDLKIGKLTHGTRAIQY